MGASVATVKYVYDFAEGSREMRDLLGGKGANVAEMTRILGAERVPAGFTITTEACVFYMQAGRELPDGLDEQVDEALERLETDRRQAARRRRRPAAGVRALGRARVDARHARHGPEPRPQRPSPSRVSPRARRTSASRGTATDASCRCSATSCAASPASASRPRSPPPRSAPASSSTPSSTSQQLRELQAAFAELFKDETGEDFPQAPRDQLAQAIRAVFDSWTGQARRRVPAHQPHPRRLGNGGQRPADGLRQQGRHVGLGRRLQPRRGHRRARAVGRLPRQRPGRGRRLGRAQHAGHRRAARRHARGARDADGDPALARGALQGHAGHGVHDRGRPSVHAADAQRQAPRPGRRALRLRRRRARGC